MSIHLTFIIFLSLCFVLSFCLSPNFCGKDSSTASSCQSPCPSGLDSECPPGEICFSNITCASTTGKYCGLDFLDSFKCTQPCPKGKDSECDSQEKCFAGVSCDSIDLSGTSSDANNPSQSIPDAVMDKESQNNRKYCGMDFSAAFECLKPCPNGLDRECDPPQKCFDDVTCVGEPELLLDSSSESPGKDGQDPSTSSQLIGQYYCGSNFEDAFKCTQPCPNGLDGQCAGSQKCFRDIICDEEAIESFAPIVSPPAEDTVPVTKPSSAEENRFADLETLSGGELAATLVGALLGTVLFGALLVVGVRKFG